MYFQLKFSAKSLKEKTSCPNNNQHVSETQAQSSIQFFSNFYIKYLFQSKSQKKFTEQEKKLS